MIWIYGGGFQFGSQNDYLAPTLVAMNDVIFVALNYRVSALGFLANQESLHGNYGLWDQHMAIQWVHDNIASFGGDPGRVVLFGESAGSASVVYQGLYENNHDLIQGFIGQSGSANGRWAFSNDPTVSYKALVDRTECKNEPSEVDVVECLRNIDSGRFQSYVDSLDMYLPTVDGDFLNISPIELFAERVDDVSVLNKHFGDLDIIMGFNTYDGVVQWQDPGSDFKGLSVEDFETSLARDAIYMFGGSPSDLLTSVVAQQYLNWSDTENGILNYKKYYELFTDVGFVVPLVHLGRGHAHANGDGKMFVYEFEHKPSYSNTPEWLDGAIHMQEIPFVSGFPGIDFNNLPNEEVQLSKAMMKYWSQFAKTGNPYNPVDNKNQVWPEYTLDKQQYIIFRSNMTSFPVKERVHSKYVYLWDVVVPKVLEVTAGCHDHEATASGSNRHFGNVVMTHAILALAYLIG